MYNVATMPLDAALRNFAAAFAAAPANSGTLAYRAAQDIDPPFPLGPALDTYYGSLELERTVVGGQLLLMLTSLDWLEAGQLAWRWISINGAPFTDNPAWDRHRIVIGTRNDDALVVDGSSAGGAVSGNIGPRIVPIADTLAGFLQVMAEAMTLEAFSYHYNVLDDDCNPDPRFLAEVAAIARRVLGPEGEAGFMHFFFG